MILMSRMRWIWWECSVDVEVKNDGGVRGLEKAITLAKADRAMTSMVGVRRLAKKIMDILIRVVLGVMIHSGDFDQQSIQ
jgi:hypothetical protein